MSLDDLNPIIFAVSLFGGYLIWRILKMASQPITTSNRIENKIFESWTVRKISKWKGQNKTTDNYKNERLDNKHFKFFGCSQDGDAFFVEFKNNDELQDANFVLALKDGTYLTIPDYLVTSTSSCQQSFSSRGLTIERILPYSKWRITFNGLIDVRKPNEQNDTNDIEPQHVTFSFFWFAASDPLSWPNNWSPKLLTRAFGHVKPLEYHLNELLFSDKGFDQFGSCFGQVTIENGASKDTFELNLPGVRTSRHLDEKITNDSQKTWSLMAACKDGFVVSLSGRDVENENKIYSGCVRMPCMETYHVKDINLNVSDFEAINCSKELVFKIEANNKIFKSILHIAPNSSQTIQSARCTTTKTPFTIDVNGQPGRGFVVSSTKVSNSRFKLEPKRDTLKQRNVWKSETLTLFFNEPDAASELLCGGKGASLAYLTQLSNSELNRKNSFVVPQGFVLTTDAFDIQIKHCWRVRDAIANIEAIAYKRSNRKLENACEEVSKLFTESPIVDEIADEIKKAYLILKNNTGASLKVAVRSSAVGEDGAESSSAGQNETFLGVQKIEQVLTSIQKCWASLFTLQSVTYRIQNIQPVNTKMSVVIQTMVAPDCAGVLFTQHPVTNDPSKLLITASYGLGESVVSGIVDPDSYVIQRSYKNNNLKVLERKLGEKDSFVFMSADEDVDSSKVNDNLRKQLCLTDENLLKLSEIGIFLQENYGTPRDIEWAILQDKIYLLQSRPMTSTRSFTPWELMHEFDTAVMSEQDYFTFGNVGEVMSQAVTPLTISTLVPSFEAGLLKNFPMYKKGTFFNQIMGISHSRLAMNVFSVFMRTCKREISMENRVHGIAIMGHEFITDEIHQIAIHRYGIASKFTEWYYMWFAMKTGWSGKSKVEELTRFMEKFNGTYNRRNLRMFQSLKELYDDVTMKIGNEFEYVQSVHGSTTMMCTIFQIILFSALAEGRKEITQDYLRDVTVLLSSCENAESAEIPILLEEIASALLRCNSSKAMEFCEVSADRGIAWLTENCITAYTLFELFIERHSHRGFQEFDFGYETWGMNPTLVISMLQKTIKNRNANEPPKKRSSKRTNEEILAELKTPSKPSTMRTIRFFLPRCSTYVELREKTKSLLIAYIHELRKSYCYLAEKMQDAALLPDMDLIFYLTHQEIGTIIEDRNRCDLINKAIRRRRFFPEWKKLRFDEFQWGVMKPQNNSNDIIGSNCEKVIGTPVCEGQVTGRACVVNTFSEVSKIKASDILITYCTDVAWSPYFPILSGVVTELGGLISHGAVVAREYGLPCIVGATNATKIIEDGEQILMDANAGVIFKLGKGKEIGS